MRQRQLVDVVGTSASHTPVTQEHIKEWGNMQLNQLAPWKPRPPALHDTPALCVCYAPRVSLILVFMMSRLAQVRLFGETAMMMSSACLCVCILLPPPTPPLTSAMASCPLGILLGLTCVLWLPANFGPPCC